MRLADATFERDGFALLPQVLDGEACTHLRALIPKILKAAERWQNAGVPLWFLQDDLPELTTLLQQPTLTTRLQNCCGLDDTPLQLLAVTLYNKRPGDPGTAWHQDARFIPADQLAALTLWLPLQAIDASNGPIQFVPGSQNHCLLSQPQLARTAPTELPQTNPCVAAPMAFGDGTVHTPWTLHGSSSNRSAGPRRALIVNYLSAPLRLNRQASLQGQCHPEIVNQLRQTNHQILSQRLQRPEIQPSPSEWLHG
ncbi:SnoK-like protein [Synechococcus sp. BS56D]|uniref:phytanoyl-CoA dioxygenase family protein n=1 Tax=Synechococcus sp. BS56D TaxID=2055944 RepID=UPI00103F4332|nr:phytanoyl-CoA dioxygenase family protein [Synechococcus sp. BS56D]TCD57586.1 SnoK-like protein [Synechococcus sp. BS56D]